MNDHGLSREGIPPGCLIELKDTVLKRERIVVVDRAFVLHAEDPVQILASGTHKRTALLCGGYREAAIKFSLFFSGKLLL